jgi:hypothetical protein
VRSQILLAHTDSPQTLAVMDVKTACSRILRDKNTSDCSFSTAEGREAWRTALDAVRAGKLAVDTKFPDGINRTLLHCAAQSCSTACVQELLQLGASPSVRDDEGSTPMSHAIYFSQYALEKCKLLPAADLNVHNMYGTPLHLAAGALTYLVQQGHHLAWRQAYIARYVDLLQWMVQQPECVVDAVNYSRCTALDILGDMAETAAARAVVRTAMEQRARWSTLRATWTATVAGAGNIAGGK